jgi:hypothetical protein
VVFQGWVAFVIFGPFDLEKDRLDLISIGDHPDKGKATSCRALQKEGAAKKDLQQFAHHDKNSNDVMRGVSMATKINLANIDLRERKLELRQKEARNQERKNSILSLNLQIGNMYKMLDRYENRAKQYTSGYDKDDCLWKKVIEQECAIEAVQEKLENLISENEQDSCMKENRKRGYDFMTPESGVMKSNKTPPTTINLSFGDDETSAMVGVDV